MGAELCIRQIPLCSKEELVKKVFAITEDMGHEDGHSYSGTWASAAPGVHITDKRFESVSEAQKYIEDNHSKWEEVMAVQALTFGERTFPITAADKDLKKRYEQLYAHVNGGFIQIVIERTRDQKSKLKTCEHCESKIAVKYVRSALCPVCSKDFLLTSTDLDRCASWGKKLNKLANQIKERKLKISIQEKGQQHTKYVWIVGGWCAS